MKSFILVLPLVLSAGMCTGPVEYRGVTPEVPAQLLEPTPISTRKVETYRDLALLATEHLNSAQQANEDKAAIKLILAGGKPQ